MSGTISPEDRGFFNYTDYETNTLRLFRIDLTAEARLHRAVSLLFDGRMDNFDSPRVYALYLRVRPWAAKDFDLQLGMVPPVFGSFPRRVEGPAGGGDPHRAAGATGRRVGTPRLEDP